MHFREELKILKRTWNISIIRYNECKFAQIGHLWTAVSLPFFFYIIPDVDILYEYLTFFSLFIAHQNEGFDGVYILGGQLDFCVLREFEPKQILDQWCLLSWWESERILEKMIGQLIWFCFTTDAIRNKSVNDLDIKQHHMSLTGEDNEDH